MSPNGSVSPHLAAALEMYKSLPREDQYEFLNVVVPQSVRLKAWAGAGTPVLDSFAPVPTQLSSPVSVSDSLSRCQGADADESEVTGCPWCRRPIAVVLNENGRNVPHMPVHLHNTTNVQVDSGKFAYVALIYGKGCHSYFLGALVLGWGLQHHTASGPARVLMHTSDVPPTYLAILQMSGWQCRCVEYISDVAGNFFHNWRKSRFVDVFTKLRALELVDFEKVLLLDLDMLVRSPEKAGCGGEDLSSLFQFHCPAAMRRGRDAPGAGLRHGDVVPFSRIWQSSARRECDRLPPHQQASGINAGVMLLKPDAVVFQQMLGEVRDWYHPEHYATYMPEQEYLSRFYSTFDRWTHIDCRFNFEIDKNERVAHDWSERHEEVRQAATDSCHHPGVVVLHYSGMGVKPWDLLYGSAGDAATLVVGSAREVGNMRLQIEQQGPGTRMEGYSDVGRLWGAMVEWLEKLSEVVVALSNQGADPIQAIRNVVKDAATDDVGDRS